MFTRPIIERDSSLKATMALCGITLAGLFTQLIRHRLLWRCCNKLQRWLGLTQQHCVVKLWPGTAFRFLLGDPYWARLLVPSFQYEPDFAHVLYRLKHIPFTFLDCGANYGYWSIFVSSEELGPHRVVAIEASPQTLQALEANCDWNANRFEIRHLAICEHSGQQVPIESAKGHAGAHINLDILTTTASTTLVTTSSLDDLVTQQNLEPKSPVILKLDVEGQEINAFKGASQLLQQVDALFYYEDHGHEPHSEVTQFVLAELGLCVFYCNENGQIIPIRSAGDANQIKTRKSVGYNFWACEPDSQFLSYFQVAR